jgi:hypothetical protein
MRLKLALLTTALAFGIGSSAALAEDAPGAKSDITIVAETPSGTDVPGTPAEGKGDEQNPGALSAPEKGEQGNPERRHDGRAGRQVRCGDPP